MFRNYRINTDTPTATRLFVGFIYACFAIFFLYKCAQAVTQSKLLLVDYSGSTQQIQAEVVNCRTHYSLRRMSEPTWGECNVNNLSTGQIQKVLLSAEQTGVYAKDTTYAMYQFSGGAITVDDHVPDILVVNLLVDAGIIGVFAIIAIYVRVRMNKSRKKVRTKRAHKKV